MSFHQAILSNAIVIVYLDDRLHFEAESLQRNFLLYVGCLREPHFCIFSLSRGRHCSSCFDQGISILIKGEPIAPELLN